MNQLFFRKELDFIDELTLEAHLKGTFGHDLGRQPGSTAAAYSFGGFWGAIGGGYQLTDDMSLRLVLDGRYTNGWKDKEKAEAFRFEVKPAIRYNLTDKIYAQSGLTYYVQLVSEFDASTFI